MAFNDMGLGNLQQMVRSDNVVAQKKAQDDAVAVAQKQQDDAATLAQKRALEMSGARAQEYAAQGKSAQDSMDKVNALRQQQFGAQRDVINQNSVADRQHADDALSRRMASIGQSGSGAAIGAQMESNRQLEGQRNQQLGGLAGQEAGAQATALGQQQDFLQKQAEFQAQQEQTAQQMDLAKQQFDIDKDSTAFNRRMAELQMNQGKPKAGVVGGALAGAAIGGVPGAAVGGIAGGLGIF